MHAKLLEQDEREFENELNELYGDASVCGMTYGQGRLLREVDPIAFKCAMNDKPEQWICEECANIYESEAEAEECCKPE